MEITLSEKVLTNRRARLPACQHSPVPVVDRSIGCGVCLRRLPGRRRRAGTKGDLAVCGDCAVLRRCADCGGEFEIRSVEGTGFSYCSPCHTVRYRLAKSGRRLVRAERECRWCFQSFAGAVTRDMHAKCASEAKRHFKVWNRLDLCVIPTCFDCGVNTPWYPVGGNVRRCESCRSATRHSSETRRRRAVVAGDSTITWRALGERDGWKCHICHERVPMRAGTAHEPDGATIDHLIPIADNGAHEWHNVAVAHRRCNLSRLTGGEVQLRLVG
jgi:hypothetical protein